jgi:hypothetical protein
MYLDDGKVFGIHQYVDFKQMVECRHEQIHIKWDLDMNDSLEVLAFTVGSRILSMRHGESSVLKEAWSTLVADVKAKCSGISESLIVLKRLNEITFYFVYHFLTLVYYLNSSCLLFDVWHYCSCCQAAY